MNQYARVYNNLIYAIDINIDDTRLPENAIKSNFGIEKIEEINANHNYLLHNIDGTINEVNNALYQELLNIEQSLLSEPEITDITILNYRILKNKTTSNDDLMIKKLEEIQKNKARNEEINNIIKVKELI